MPYSQTDSHDLTDLASDISFSDREAILSQHQDILNALDTLDAIEALKAPTEEPAPVVAEFVSEPWALEPVEATPADLDGALAGLNLDTPDQAAAPTSGITPATRALMEKTRDEILLNNLRNGRKAQKYKAQQRDDYAAMIMATEGREVREYKKNPTPDRIRDQNNARKQKQRKNQTPEQRKAENAKRTERRRKQKERTEAEAKAALEDQALFS